MQLPERAVPHLRGLGVPLCSIGATPLELSVRIAGKMVTSLHWRLVRMRVEPTPLRLVVLSRSRELSEKRAHPPLVAVQPTSLRFIKVLCRLIQEAAL